MMTSDEEVTQQTFVVGLFKFNQDLINGYLSECTQFKKQCSKCVTGTEDLRLGLEVHLAACHRP